MSEALVRLVNFDHEQPDLGSFSSWPRGREAQAKFVHHLIKPVVLAGLETWLHTAPRRP